MDGLAPWGSLSISHWPLALQVIQVLATGGTGYFGGAIVRALAGHGHVPGP
jgi:hypothetical protein